MKKFSLIPILFLLLAPALKAQVLREINDQIQFRTFIDIDERDESTCARIHYFMVKYNNDAEVLLNLPYVRSVPLFDSVDINTVALCVIEHMGGINLYIFKYNNKKWIKKSTIHLLSDENAIYRDDQSITVIDNCTLYVCIDKDTCFTAYINYCPENRKYVTYKCNFLEKKQE